MPDDVWDHCPEKILQWVRKQHVFWVSTAPLSPNGHVNVSPKSIKGTFHLLDNGKECWYEDITGSGCETISHLRENGRITLLFCAFEGAPRVCRFHGTGKVYEYGTPEYFQFIPGDTRLPGSRSVITIDIHRVALSCGYTVPRFQFIEHRDTLKKFLAIREKPDAGPEKTIQALWTALNLASIDGIPGLQTAHLTQGTPPSSWGTEWMKIAHPKSHGIEVKEKPTGSASMASKVSAVGGTLKNYISLALTHVDQRTLVGIVIGVLFSTLMSHIGVPLI